jgi:hypothetical protein
MLVTLSMPRDADASGSISGLGGSFGVGLYAAGDDAAAPIAREGLADTGLNLAGPALAALGILGLGLAIRAHRRAPDATDGRRAGDGA